MQRRKGAKGNPQLPEAFLCVFAPLRGKTSLTLSRRPLMLNHMEQELNFRIVLESPPPGVDFGLQKGGGNNFEVTQKQRSKTGDLKFEFNARVKEGKEGSPVFLGPFVQGPPHERFVYIDIGTIAGQTDTPWSRRLKVPLRDLTWDLVNKALRGSKTLETRVPGTARDGSPTCATVKPFAGWKLSR